MRPSRLQSSNTILKLRKLRQHTLQPGGNTDVIPAILHTQRIRPRQLNSVVHRSSFPPCDHTVTDSYTTSPSASTVNAASLDGPCAGNAFE